MPKREYWYIKNVSGKQITIGDLPRVPTLSPGRSLDLLDYHPKADIQQRRHLLTVLTNGWFQLTKVLDGTPQTVTTDLASESTAAADKADVIASASRTFARVLLSLNDVGMTAEIGFFNAKFYGYDGSKWVCLTPSWNSLSA